jgi:3-oxoacyl-[acyl-carrier protein] reductase
MIRHDFTGKIVLVTGSSRGIGAEILRSFARSGATCVLHFWDDPAGDNHRDALALQAELEPAPVRVLAGDVRDAVQIQSLMKHVQEELGGLDILVNNAGILRDRTLKKMTLDDWHAVLQTGRRSSRMVGGS